MTAWAARAAGPLCVAAAFAVVLVMTAVSWARPQLNWDMMAYIAIERTWSGASPAQAHDQAYADVARYTASHGFDAKLAALRGDPFRLTVATDAAAFEEQMPFYRIRPLYVAAVHLLAQLTSTVTAAVVLLSALAFAATALLVLAVGLRMLGPVPGSLLSMLFTLSPPVSTAAVFQTPDGVLMALTAAAVALLVGGRPLWGAALLTLGVLVRTDLQVFDLCLAALWLLLLRRQRGTWAVAGLLASSVVVASAVSRWAGNYGYRVLYHYTFMEEFNPHPASLADLPIPPMTFLRNLVYGLRYSLDNGSLWLILAMLALCGTVMWRRGQVAAALAGDPLARACAAILGSVLAYMGARYLLFPAHDLRLIAPSLAASAILLAVVARRTPPGAAPMLA